jgi:hypothetical protein
MQLAFDEAVRRVIESYRGYLAELEEHELLLLEIEEHAYTDEIADDLNAEAFRLRGIQKYCLMRSIIDAALCAALENNGARSELKIAAEKC